MSDAAKVAHEWLYERSLSLDRTEDLAAMLEAYAAEQAAAEAAKHADCCVDREELAALRAYTRHLTACGVFEEQSCDCGLQRLLDGPEAAP